MCGHWACSPATSKSGKVTGDKRLKAEGKADQGKADVKQSGVKAKDAAKKVTK